LLHKLSVLSKPYLAAVDSTSFSLTNPSRHYTNVLQGRVTCPAKLSVFVDTRTSKAIALRFRAKQAHDARDIPYLLRHSTNLPKKIVGDSAYDAENSVFKPCAERNIIAVVKPRKTWHRGRYRHKMRQHYNLKTYHRRPTVEGFFSRLKQRYGGSLRCRKARTQRAEIYARVTLHNIISEIKEFFYSTWHCTTFIKASCITQLYCGDVV
jgi:transposase